MQWKPRALILDLFGDYLRYAGSEVRLADITELLAVFDVEPATVQRQPFPPPQGGLVHHPAGRQGDGLLPHPAHARDPQRRPGRIFRHREESWQGRWTMVIYQVPESERAVREQLRKRLAWHGFGQLSPSTWLAPHDLFDDVRGLTAEYPLAKIDVLWCGTGDLEQDRDIAGRCWDLEHLGSDYREFIRSYNHLDNESVNAQKDGQTALIERMQVIGDFRRFPFRDPVLPRELQPADWPSGEAYALFGAIHRQLGPAATDFVSGIIGQPVEQGREILM